MPEIDGIATFRELQSRLETEHIPLILLTAKAQNENFAGRR
jgi:two-component system alkaline phosphatase synthesis response regulator PhoP